MRRHIARSTLLLAAIACICRGQEPTVSAGGSDLKPLERWHQQRIAFEQKQLPNVTRIRKEAHRKQSFVQIAARNPTSAQHPPESVLEPAYPNPFNPATVISSQMPALSNVTLRVYDMLGREVKGRKEAGYYTATFNGEGLASGMYVARLSVTDGAGKPTVQSIKMQLIR